ncbi:MAG: hypothetical protein CSA45_06775, partial [Gammaproteobacteria bacterium]
KAMQEANNVIEESRDGVDNIAGGVSDVKSEVPAKAGGEHKEVTAGDGDSVGGGGPEGNIVRVNTQNSTTRGTVDYDSLNNFAPNTRYELDNGTTFRTNSGSHVEEVTYTPNLNKIPRDRRQTQVGKEGFPDDVGGHIQACSMGGTCDRFNLFPQNKNFNNGEYKKWENEIRDALKRGDDVGSVTVRFRRSDPNATRPDALRVEYSINGETIRRNFKNQLGG